MNFFSKICRCLFVTLGFFIIVYEFSYFVEEVQGGCHYSAITNMFPPEKLPFILGGLIFKS